MHPTRQFIWGNIWQHTAEKNHSNAPIALFKQEVKMRWKNIMSTDTRAKHISAVNVIILLVINIPWIYTWKTNTLEWDLTAQSVNTRPRKKEIWKFTWRQSMMESSMLAINASMKPAPREVLVYTWNQNTDAQLIKTIKLWKSVFNADDDEDWEDDNLVWHHLNHFMAPQWGPHTIQTTRETRPTNVRQGTSKDL